MNAGELLKQDLLKVLKSLEYRFDVASELPTDSGRVYLSFEDVSKTDMKYEDFETALRYLGKTFDGLEVVRVYDYMNENADIEATYIGYLPSFAEIILPEKFKDMAETYRTKLSSGALQQPVRLSEMDVSFDDESGVIRIGKRECVLPSYKNGHCLCRVMFKHPISVPIDWSVISEEMTGNDPILEDGLARTSEQLKKSVYDTMRDVNKRIREEIVTPDELFTSEAKTIVRNF